jgi:hypothetical protein
MILLFLFSLISYAEDSTVFLFMIDGARPDVVEKLASEGKLPNIQKNFIENGTVMENSFTTLSLTVPSWSSILSGADIDQTGIKGNDLFDRNSKEITNFLDWRGDILIKENRLSGRAYTHLKNSGVKTALDYFNLNQENVFLDPFDPRSEVFFTFFPLNKVFPTFLLKTLPNNLLSLDVWKHAGAQRALTHFFFKSHGMDAVDRDATEQALKIIQAKNGKKKKLVGIYFASVDHASHAEHKRGRRTLQKVDYLLGKIFKAIQSSRYKNSTFVLVSDHGSLGGEEFSHSKTHPLAGKTAALTNTNLSHYFSGWYNKVGYADYNFNVEAAFATEGKFSLNSFSELQMQPKQCTNVAKNLRTKYESCEDFQQKSPQKIHAAVTTTQTISLPFQSKDSNNWKQTNDWYSLSNYDLGHTKKNIIEDLENFQLDNLLVYNSKSRDLLGLRPLDWLATKVFREDFLKSKIAKQLNLQSDEDIIVIHHSKQKQAIILTEGKKFRYIPVKNFDQQENRSVSFELSSEDPFGYYANPLVRENGVSDESWFAQFHSPRDWVERYADTKYPNAVPAMAKLFQNNGSKKLDKWKFDLVLNPNYGHYFTVHNDTHEVNHGMWQRESVRNLFMISGTNVKKGYRVKKAVLAVDTLPTAFGVAGYQFTYDPKVEGKMIEEVLNPF